ncbi:MAG: DegV family protein [Bacillota bacterium]
MKPIKIIADSMSDIPIELQKEYGITVLPLTIRFGEEEYKDGVDLKAEAFFGKLKAAPKLPTTSQVPPMKFQSEIQRYADLGYDVLVINGSSGVSGTHQSAVMAKTQLDIPGVEVFDTLALSYGCGMMVVEAGKMAKQGYSKDEILTRLQDMKERTDHIFSVDTLEFLQKGGRLSASKAMMGTILNVKPILTIVEGKVDSLDKVRGSRKVIPRMIELAKERGMKKGCERVGIAHGANIEGLEKLKEEIIREFEPVDLVMSEIGGTIGTYTGPGLLALFYLKG